MKLTFVNLRQICGQMKKLGNSMRLRFFLYLLSLVCAFAALLLLLLSFFGILNSADRKLAQTFDHQIEASVSKLENHFDQLAAYGISFSSHLSRQIEVLLRQENLSFSELKNQEPTLTMLQKELYPLVSYYLRLVPCSGAFFFLDTTVNDSLPECYFNGLYLKFANISAENTIHNKICMFRGASLVARENKINLHSSWQLETRQGVFPQAEALIHGTDASLSESYLLTDVYSLPDTWEQVRLLCLPILDRDGNTIGVCGFEISDLYFRLSYENTEEKQLAFALLTEDQKELFYSGQTSSAYLPAGETRFRVEEGQPFDRFYSENNCFIGKSQPVSIGSSEHLAAAMTPQTQYDSLVRQERLHTVLMLLIAAAFAVSAGFYLSRRYVSPILQEQERTQLLFRRQLAEAQDETSKMRSELSRLTDSRKQEIDPEQYALFLEQLKTLTPKEQEVFAFYMDGKKPKEIATLMGITENTLKFHNKNLYSKLGVTSRKELLLYAQLIKGEKRDD